MKVLFRASKNQTKICSEDCARKGGLLFTLPLRINPLGANPTKWSNTLKQFVSNLPKNCLSVFDHFVKLALKELKAKKHWT